MDETNIEQDIKGREALFEFFNYWTRLQHMKRFELFSISWNDDIFAFDDALSVIILNFEFRFYFKKTKS